MALKDLVVSEKAVTEETLEQVLSGFVQLADDTHRAILTLDGSKLSARVRIMLVLASRYAWRFVNPEQEQSTAMALKEIGEQAGIPGGTLRPALMALKDAKLVENPRPGVHSLPPHSLALLAEKVRSLRGTSPR